MVQAAGDQILTRAAKQINRADRRRFYRDAGMAKRNQRSRRVRLYRGGAGMASGWGFTLS